MVVNVTQTWCPGLQRALQRCAVGRGDGLNPPNHLSNRSQTMGPLLRPAEPAAHAEPQPLALWPCRKHVASIVPLRLPLALLVLPSSCWQGGAATHSRPLGPARLSDQRRPTSAPPCPRASTINAHSRGPQGGHPATPTWSNSAPARRSNPAPASPPAWRQPSSRSTGVHIALHTSIHSHPPSSLHQSISNRRLPNQGASVSPPHPQTHGTPLQPDASPRPPTQAAAPAPLPQSIVR